MSDEVLDIFRKWANLPIRIISSTDVDGIFAASIFIKSIKDRQFHYSSCRLLKEQQIKSLSLENSDYFVFIDLGSNVLPLIKQYIKKNVIVIDTHQETDFFDHDISVLYSKSSTSALVYDFASKYSDVSIMSPIGVIGSLSTKHGIDPLILKIALENKLILKKQGLPIFGQQTRYMHKALEYSTELNIPGVTGSESGALVFLNEIGISTKTSSLWRKFCDLSDDEMILLIEAIAKKINKADFLVDRYILPKQPQGPTKDVQEFSALITACVKMEQATLAVSTCLGNSPMREKAIETEHSFRREVAKAVSWFDEHQNDKKI